MLLNKNQSNTIFIIILLLILLYFIYYQYNQYNNTKDNFGDFKTCTMNLQDIDPRLVDQYKKYDGKHVACGPCSDSTLNVNIKTCPTDVNGSPSSDCLQNAIISSNYTINNINYKQNIPFPNRINPISINTFFCFEDD